MEDVLGQVGADDAIFAGWRGDALPAAVRNEQRAVETEIKYAGYLVQQMRSIGKMKKAEEMKIPAWFDYRAVSGLSREMQQTFERVRPGTLGQASRLPGVTPAAVSLLHVYVEIQGRKRGEAALTDGLVCGAGVHCWPMLDAAGVTCVKALGFVLMMFTMAGAQAPEEPLATLKIGTRVVAVAAVVVDAQGSPVRGLEKSAFVLKQDGVEQPIRYFSEDTDLPLTLALMVDTSGSEKAYLEEESDGERGVFQGDAAPADGPGFAVFSSMPGCGNSCTR